jgi:hypothetical protein
MLIKNYSEEDIYSADETVLFCNMIHDVIFTFKGEKWVGRKRPQNCLTISLCVNTAGTDKIRCEWEVV